MRIYTGTGDSGDTRRFDGAMVRKSDLLPEAQGGVDELSSQLGLCVCEARQRSGEMKTACAELNELADLLEQTQRRLIGLGCLLSLSETHPHPSASCGISDDCIGRMEAWIDRMSESLPKLDHFVLPGGCELAARLHVARTVCRRIERAVVRLADRENDMPLLALKYMNRLGDMLFTAARTANRLMDTPDSL
jgi:cob(I)alamin adenosyltransferase